MSPSAGSAPAAHASPHFDIRSHPDAGHSQHSAAVLDPKLLHMLLHTCVDTALPCVILIQRQNRALLCNVEHPGPPKGQLALTQPIVRGPRRDGSQSCLARPLLSSIALVAHVKVECTCTLSAKIPNLATLPPNCRRRTPLPIPATCSRMNEHVHRAVFHLPCYSLRMKLKRRFSPPSSISLVAGETGSQGIGTPAPS